MAKVTVCDMCKNDGKLTETKRYYSVKNNRNLRLDYCNECAIKIPQEIKHYVVFVYALKGATITIADAKRILGR